jgi:hypothetical protein
MTLRQVLGVAVLLLPLWIYIALNAKTIPWKEVMGGTLGLLLVASWLVIGVWLLTGGGA